ncbi:MAG: prepilin-type N-terminal cleavage/methylation domain-containing protein [Kiritimatiellae bacterium]|nr:prepilin-type N-terminal cleavage/methylation domain-containing protein [Kiritimatiellia bacterium]
MNPRAGFSLVEVLVASVILATGLLAILAAMTQSQRLMMASKRFEDAQYVFCLGEMAHPVPPPEKVTGDPLDDELLNVEETTVAELVRELESDGNQRLHLSREREQELETYTFTREVDEYEDFDGRSEEEILEANGKLYTLRTTVRWGGKHYGAKQEEDVTVRLWRRK